MERFAWGPIAKKHSGEVYMVALATREINYNLVFRGTESISNLAHKLLRAAMGLGNLWVIKIKNQPRRVAWTSESFYRLPLREIVSKALVESMYCGIGCNLS